MALVEGILKCRKTTYIINYMGVNDIVLTSTREGAQDMKARNVSASNV